MKTKTAAALLREATEMTRWASRIPSSPIVAKAEQEAWEAYAAARLAEIEARRAAR